MSVFALKLKSGAVYACDRVDESDEFALVQVGLGGRVALVERDEIAGSEGFATRAELDARYPGAVEPE